MIKVETVATSRWEIDDEKIFVLYQDEWEEYISILDGKPDEYDRLDFVKEILWQINPFFKEVGGIEVWDDYDMEVKMK